MARATVGSASAATVISRLAPMPPNARARVETGQREKERAEQQQVHDREQVADGVERQRHGDDRHEEVTATVVANTTNGAKRKIHEALRETTTSFPKSLRSSKYGCQAGAPRRFCSRAFTQRIRPTSPGASTSASTADPARADSPSSQPSRR